VEGSPALGVGSRPEVATVLVPKRIICEDKGTGLTHSEFLHFDFAAHFLTPMFTARLTGRNGAGTARFYRDRSVIERGSQKKQRNQ